MDSRLEVDIQGVNLEVKPQQQGEHHARVRVDVRGSEHLDVGLLTGFDHLLHVVKHGNAKLLAQLLQRRRPKFDLGRLDRDFQTCLHHAARYDRAESLQVLLISSISLDINARGADGWTPLHTAARFSAAACTRLLLRRSDLEVEARTDLGLTALHFTAKYSNITVAALLLERGARLDARDNDGHLPIVYAVKNGDAEMCELLCSKNSPLQVKDNAGKTPFAVACHAGDVPMMQLLLKLFSKSLQNPSRMLCEQDFQGLAPLHHAVLSGCQEAVSLLLSSGVPVDVPNIAGRTPLLLACQSGHGSILRTLLTAGADPNLSDRQGTSPLHMAAQKTNPDFVEVLLTYGADATAQDESFRTALHVACHRGAIPVIRALFTGGGRHDRGLRSRDNSMSTCLHLLAARRPPNIAVDAFRQLISSCSVASLQEPLGLGDSRNESVLHVAVRAENPELTRLLLEFDADVYVRSIEELCPAELAASLGNLECGRLLLGAASTRNRSSVVANSALLLAAQSGHFNFVDYLIDSYRVDVNWTNQFGCSALMLAVSGGHARTAARLIESGCDVNLQDKSQNTALHYAAKQDKSGICVQLLVEASATLTENGTGEVPLDLAATSGNEAAIEVFLSPGNFEAFKAFRRSTGETLFDVLVENSPKYAMKVLDNSIIKSKCGALDKDFSVTLDFQALDPGPYDPASSLRYYWGTKTMADNMQYQLLTHPVTAVLTLHKWRTFGRYYFFVDMFLYLIFMAANTAFILDQKPPLPSDLNPRTGCLNDTGGGDQQGLGRRQLYVEKFAVLIFVGLRLLLEITKLISKGYRYFLNIESYFYLALIATTGVFMWPPHLEPCTYNWACGVFSIALTWAVYLFQMQNVPYTGIYAIMFQDVLKTLIKALSVFVFLLMGFSLSFYISNQSMDPFRSFDRAFLKTFDMALGEFEYESYFEALNGIFREYAQTIFVFFAIVVSVALINLLVGLAVGDIEMIRKNSSTKLIGIEVELLCEMQSLFPRWLQRRVHRNTLQIYPNKRQYQGRLLHWLFADPFVKTYLKAELRRSLIQYEDKTS